MKIRALLLATSMAAALTGCQNMDSNGLLSSGAEAFQAYSLSDTQVKALSDQACKGYYRPCQQRVHNASWQNRRRAWRQH